MAEGGEKSWLRRRADVARQGIEANFWGLVVLSVGAVAWAWLRDGDVPAWVLGVVVVTAAVILAMVATSLLRRKDQLSGQLTEARQQLDQAQQRVGELERRSAEDAEDALPMLDQAARPIVRRIRALRQALESASERDEGTVADAAGDQIQVVIQDLRALLGANGTLDAARSWADQASYMRRVNEGLVTLDQLEALAMDYTEPSGPMGSMS